MPDINDKLSSANPTETPLEQEAHSAASRESWRATNAGYGTDKAAEAMVNGGTLPQEQDQMMMMGGMQGPMPMQDPMEMLRAQSTAKEKEVSLDTLTEDQKKKIMDSFKRCKQVAENHYTSVIEPEVLRRREIYEADEAYYNRVFPQLSESCKWVSKDVKTSCGWILPNLLEAFTGTDDPLSVKGVSVEDDEVADKIQMLVRYQLEKKNSYHQFCASCLEAALAENFAIAKIWWKREEKHKRMQMMLDANDNEQFINVLRLIEQKKIEIKKAEEIKDAPDLIKLEYDELTLVANHPVVEYVPSSELRYTPDAPRLHECKFVAHRKVVRGDYLKRRELDGIYQNIDEAIEEYHVGKPLHSILDYENDPDRFNLINRPDDGDKASKEVELYEAYLQVDWNDDGVLENIIVHAVGDVPIRIAENDYEFPPFFVCSSLYDANAVFNRDSFSDTLGQLQDLKTALIRQVIINVAKNNSPRVFVNERNVDIDSLIGGEEIIPITGSPAENIMTPPQLPLSGVTMEMVQYAQNEIEAQSGSTRYNQGLDSNSLNNTATGITAIMGASEKRMKMIARSIAENFFIPIYKFIILLNQKYLEGEQMVRLTSKNVSIKKEDLDIDYDLIVNVGQGAGTREAQIQYLMLVLNQIYPQLSAQGIVNAKSWYNLVCKLLEQLGLRDVTQYLLDPSSPEAQQQAEAAQAAAAQKEAEALQNSLQLSIAKSSVPRLTVQLTDLPPDVQKQYLEQKLGIKTTEKEIAEHEILVRNS